MVKHKYWFLTKNMKTGDYCRISNADLFHVSANDMAYWRFLCPDDVTEIEWDKEYGCKDKEEKFMIMHLLLYVSDAKDPIDIAVKTKVDREGKRLPNPKRRNTLTPCIFPLSSLFYQSDIDDAKQSKKSVKEAKASRTVNTDADIYKQYEKSKGDSDASSQESATTLSRKINRNGKSKQLKPAEEKKKGAPSISQIDTASGSNKKPPSKTTKDSISAESHKQSRNSHSHTSESSEQAFPINRGRHFKRPAPKNKDPVVPAKKPKSGTSLQTSNLEKTAADLPCHPPSKNSSSKGRHHKQDTRSTPHLLSDREKGHASKKSSETEATSNDEVKELLLKLSAQVDKLSKSKKLPEAENKKLVELVVKGSDPPQIMLSEEKTATLREIIGVSRNAFIFTARVNELCELMWPDGGVRYIYSSNDFANAEEGGMLLDKIISQKFTDILSAMPWAKKDECIISERTVTRQIQKRGAYKRRQIKMKSGVIPKPAVLKGKPGPKKYVIRNRKRIPIAASKVNDSDSEAAASEKGSENEGSDYDADGTDLAADESRKSREIPSEVSSDHGTDDDDDDDKSEEGDKSIENLDLNVSQYSDDLFDNNSQTAIGSDDELQNASQNSQSSQDKPEWLANIRDNEHNVTVRRSE